MLLWHSTYAQRSRCKEERLQGGSKAIAAKKVKGWIWGHTVAGLPALKSRAMAVLFAVANTSA